jgi:hypothetical protein
MEIILKEDNKIIRNQKTYQLSKEDFDKVRDCLIIIDEILTKRSK